MDQELVTKVYLGGALKQTTETIANRRKTLSLSANGAQEADKLCSYPGW